MSSHTRLTNVLILDSDSYRWNDNAAVLHSFFDASAGITSTLTADKAILTSHGLDDFDVVILGGGFTRQSGKSTDPGTRYTPEMTREEGNALLDFVNRGKGFIGVHATGWFVGWEHFKLLGGHANFHPEISSFETFVVEVVDQAHPITEGVSDFALTGDECYLAAFSPEVHVLATVDWASMRWPVAWTHTYGAGRVVYTALGHRPPTFEQPMMQRLLLNATRWAAPQSV
jgi:hypothetical protein